MLSPFPSLPLSLLATLANDATAVEALGPLRRATAPFWRSAPLEGDC